MALQLEGVAGGADGGGTLGTPGLPGEDARFDELLTTPLQPLCNKTANATSCTRKGRFTRVPLDFGWGAKFPEN